MAKQDVPSLAPDDEGRPDPTKRYEPISQRVHVGPFLPEYVVAELEVLSGPDIVGTLPVNRAHTTIGRGDDADIRVLDDQLSRRHVSILFDGSEFRIRDENSANGTFLNGSKVIEYALRDGDKILVGDSLFRFRLARRS